MRVSKDTAIYQKEKTCFFAVVCAFVLSLVLYMYFVSASVYHVVIRKEIDREIASAFSEVSLLEAAYIDAQHAVSESIATMDGFVVSEEKIFIDRTGDSLVLSINNER